MRHSITRALCLGLTLGLSLSVAGCESGPDSALTGAAKALEDRDSGAFLSRIDMPAYAAHEMMNLKETDSLVAGLDALGGLLGIAPQIEMMMRDVLRLESGITRTFTRTAGSGELVNQCSRATTPDCPWVPASLRDAKVKTLGEDAAVASVTTPAGMTSWIALRRQDGAWRIVGKAVLEDTAVRYAQDENPLPAPDGGTPDVRPSETDTKL